MSTDKYKALAKSNIVIPGEHEQIDDTVDNSQYLGIGDEDDYLWIDTPFLVKIRDVDATYRDVVMSTGTAFSKVGDSSIGGHIVVNPPYQWNAICDVPSKGRGGNISVSKMSVLSDVRELGQGEIWSTMIDDNMEILTLETGVPKFKNIVSYLTNSVNITDQIVANEGRLPGTAYTAGLGVGVAASFYFFAWRALYILAAKGVKQIMSMAGSPRFYTHKPDMHVYWSTVNNIATILYTEEGLYSEELLSYNTKPLAENTKYDVDDLITNAYDAALGTIKDKQSREKGTREQQADRVGLDRLYKGLFDGKNGVFQDGSIDILSLVSRTTKKLQTIVEKENAALLAAAEETDDTKTLNSIVDSYENVNYGDVDKIDTLKESPTVTIRKEGFNAYATDEILNKIESTTEGATAAPKNNEDTSKRPTTDDSNNLSNYWENVVNTLKSVLATGGSTVSFSVEHTKTLSESFSNDTQPVMGEGLINSGSMGIRDIRFSLPDLNMNAVTTAVTNATKDLMLGAIDGFTGGFGNLLTVLLGYGLMSYDHMWSDSNAQYQTLTYKIILGGPYSNTISRVQDIIVPLSCLLPLVLPKAIGDMAYTSPPLLRVHNRGRQISDLAMVTSFTVRRGNGGYGFTVNGKVTNIEIEFTVADLSHVLAAPVNSSTFGSFIMASNDASPFNRYLATIGGRSLYTDRFFKPKLLMKLARLESNIGLIANSTLIGARGGDTLKALTGGLFTGDGTMAR